MAKGKKGARWSGPSVGPRSKTPPKVSRKERKANEDADAWQRSYDLFERRNTNYFPWDRNVFIRYSPSAQPERVPSGTILCVYPNCTIQVESSSHSHVTGSISQLGVIYTIKYYDD